MWSWSGWSCGGWEVCWTHHSLSTQFPFSLAKVKFIQRKNEVITRIKYFILIFDIYILYYFIIYIKCCKLIFLAFPYNRDAMSQKLSSNTLTENKKALFDYEIIEEYEAGIKLFGEEVKSARNGSINLKWSYILIDKLRPYIVGMHIGEYRGGMRKPEPKRNRDILLKTNEILNLSQKIKEMGATIVPVSIYTKWNLIKVRIALVKWKKTWQKKNLIKKRDLEREMRWKFRI